ncbi:hypothetical protein BKA93DRAFT_746245 [Sparassis latifolia]
MRNWEAAYECEDARDSERLRKRATLLAESCHLTKSMYSSVTADTDDDVDVTSHDRRSAVNDFKIQQFVSLLEQCNWLHHNTYHKIAALSTVKYNITHLQLQKWKSALHEQEMQVMQKRRNAGNMSSQFTLEKTPAYTEYYMTPTIPEQLTTSTEAPNMSDTTALVEQSPMKVLQSVQTSYSLNAKQACAFQICAKHFIQNYVVKSDTVMEPLYLLLTGPGGTGKTHVVKALKELMTYFGCLYQIRFLAPTGSAAALIDGMTIHKGLGLKIQSKTKGKGNRRLGESEQDYTVTISVQNRTVLRDEWQRVEFVLIDEISLVSSYARQTSDELSKRLGRLAWKQVNAVVELTEQQRMKDDPEYGDAVNRLRTRECTMGDVDLFNTRVVKSATHLDGLQIKDDDDDPTVIVNTNLLRQVINTEKAQANCDADNGLSLIICTAVDKIDGQVPEKSIRDALLRLNVTPLTSEGALPAFISLYVGMPVVLRSRNISTELGITNGAQGIVRHISIKHCPVGYTYADCVIVEFPTSKVHLPDLPSGYVPIAPTTWRFTTTLRDANGDTQRYQVTRLQLIIQPAFAVTGHTSQGKTLPKVLNNMTEGGFAAYVAASRARTRNGLFISEPVKLEQLNKPVSADLYHETQKFKVLEQNTLIHYGFKTGSLVPLPNPESENDISTKSFHVNFSDSSSQSKGTKRKASQMEESGILPSISMPHSDSSPYMYKHGCQWSSTDYSCAYDATFMSLYHSYSQLSSSLRAMWKNQSAIASLLEHTVITPIFDLEFNMQTTYSLATVIYFGSSHFTARLLHSHNSGWIYDDQQNDGVPQYENRMDTDDLTPLLTLDGRWAHILVYTSNGPFNRIN